MVDWPSEPMYEASLVNCPDESPLYPGGPGTIVAAMRGINSSAVGGNEIPYYRRQAMMTRHERAKFIWETMSHQTVGGIEKHLDEACEEAVREAEDRARYKPTSEEIQEEIIREENRPTAEDALKAVIALEKKVNMGAMAFIVPDISAGCNDLLAGKRDTEAARSITGEGK